MKVGGLSVLLSILLSITIILGSFFVISLDNNFHSKNAIKNLDYDSIQLNTVFNELHYLINYLNSPFSEDKVLDNVDLTEAEKSHMSDVKKIFLFIQLMMVASLVSILILVNHYKKKLNKKEFDKLISKSLRTSSIINISFILLIGFFALFFFESFWTYFHYLFFPQGNWAFPWNSLLITLFPPSYFYNFILNFILAVITYSGLMYFIGKKTEKS